MAASAALQGAVGFGLGLIAAVSDIATVLL
jgi:hypothetical protein